MNDSMQGLHHIQRTWVASQAADLSSKKKQLFPKYAIHLSRCLYPITR